MYLLYYSFLQIVLFNFRIINPKFVHFYPPSLISIFFVNSENQNKAWPRVVPNTKIFANLAITEFYTKPLANI